MILKGNHCKPGLKKTGEAMSTLAMQKLWCNTSLNQFLIRLPSREIMNLC